MYQAGKFGYNAAKWLTAPVERRLTLVNNFRKNIFTAVCVYTEAGSVSTGWIFVESGDSESIGIPVPRVIGNTWVAIFSRTRKGKFAFTGTGNEQRKFHVAVPRFSNQLGDSSAFTVQDAATNKPRLIMNQGGVERMSVVTGRLISMTGDFKYTYQ